MIYTPRDYQVKATEIGISHLYTYNNPFVLVLPTGSGKSIIISEICHKIDEPIIILQPSAEILQQNYEKLISYDITDIGIYSASMKSKTINKFTYATIGSVYKKPELFRHFKYAILDECHELNPKILGGMYNRFFRDIGIKSICGLTATPWRLIKKFYQQGGELMYTTSLSTINRIHPFFFKKFAYHISIQELIEMGYLCKPEYKFYKDFDVSELKINSTGADYDEISLEKFWNDARLKKLSSVIMEVDKECKYNLIFCSSIRQATRCSEMLIEMGLSSAVISSKDSSIKRQSVLAGFKSGAIKHLCNVGILTTGYDFPALDCVTLARPTLSLGLLYQISGRCMRKDPENPNKTAKIIDITDNIKKLGRIETIKLGKEDGFKDTVETERGQISGKPLFTFRIKNEEKRQKYFENKQKMENLFAN